MTNVQRRRANSIARAFAEHPVAVAIVNSTWQTVTRYAKQRLRKSQPSLSLYLSGARETPPEVADKVKKDFGLGDHVWVRPPHRLRKPGPGTRRRRSPSAKRK